MSQPSDWPLPSDGKRFLLPKSLIDRLAAHPLSEALYPRALGFYPVAARHRMARAEHDDHLLIYCTAGQGWLQLGEGAPRPVAQGDVLLLPAGRAHGYWADEQRPWTLYWIHFDGAKAWDFVRWLAVDGVRHLGLNAKLLAGFDTMFELRARGAQWPAALHACHQLQLMLSHMALVFDRQAHGQGGSLDLERIKALMMARLHGRLNLDQLAADAKLSKYHFAKRFKSLTGQSPIHYFIELKMQQACYLLDTSRAPVKQLALGLGYEDAYYFSRLFKTVMGVSPIQYRAGLHSQAQAPG